MGDKKKKNKKVKKVLEVNIVLRDFLQKIFEGAGYLCEAGACDDESGSWLNVRKKDDPLYTLELSFNYEGTEFTDFDVWKDVMEVADTKKIF